MSVRDTRRDPCVSGPDVPLRSVSPSLCPTGLLSLHQSRSHDPVRPPLESPSLSVEAPSPAQTVTRVHDTKEGVRTELQTPGWTVDRKESEKTSGLAEERIIINVDDLGLSMMMTCDYQCPFNSPQFIFTF